MPFESTYPRTQRPSVLLEIACELENVISDLREVVSPITSTPPTKNPTEALDHLPEVLRRIKASSASLRELKDSIVI